MRSCCIPDIVKITFKVLQTITYIIKTEAMSHVAINHTDDMTPYTECPSCYLDSIFFSSAHTFARLNFGISLQNWPNTVNLSVVFWVCFFTPRL